MDPRIESMVSAFIEEEDLTCRVYKNDAVAVQTGDRKPWTIDFLLKEEGGFIYAYLPVTVPVTRVPAVRRACRTVERTRGVSCFRDEDGDVILAERLAPEIPEEAFGQYCLRKLRKLDRVLENDLFPRLVFALESRFPDRVFFLLSTQEERGEGIPLWMDEWDDSELYHTLMRRRFAEEIRQLGVIDMTDSPVSAEISRESDRADGEAQARPGKRAAGKRPQRQERKPKNKEKTGLISLILYLLLAVLTLQTVFAQFLYARYWAVEYSRSFLGLRNELVVYGLLAIWTGLLVPRLMHKRRWIAANVILVFSAFLYAVLVLLLNNLWHCLARLDFFAAVWTRLGPGSMFAAILQLLGQDLRPAEGTADHRYLGAFLVALTAIVIGYVIRYALQPKLKNAMTGSRGRSLTYRLSR